MIDQAFEPRQESRNGESESRCHVGLGKKIDPHTPDVSSISLDQILLGQVSKREPLEILPSTADTCPLRGSPSHEPPSPTEREDQNGAMEPPSTADAGALNHMASVQTTKVGSARRTKRSMSLCSGTKAPDAQVFRSSSSLSQTLNSQGSGDQHSDSTSPSERDASLVGLVWSSSFSSTSTSTATPRGKPQGSSDSPGSVDSTKKLGIDEQQPMPEVWLDPSSRDRTTSATSSSTDSTAAEKEASSGPGTGQVNDAVTTGKPLAEKGSNEAPEGQGTCPEVEERPEGDASEPTGDEEDEEGGWEDEADVALEEANGHEGGPAQDSLEGGSALCDGADGHSISQRHEDSHESVDRAGKHSNADNIPQKSCRGAEGCPTKEHGAKGKGSREGGTTTRAKSTKKSLVGGKGAEQKRGAKTGVTKKGAFKESKRSAASRSVGSKSTRHAQARSDSEAAHDTRWTIKGAPMLGKGAGTGFLSMKQGAVSAGEGHTEQSKSRPRRKEGTAGQGGRRKARSLPLTPRGTREPTGNSKEGKVASTSFTCESTGASTQSGSQGAEGHKEKGADKEGVLVQERPSKDETFFATVDSFESSDSSEGAALQINEEVQATMPAAQGEIQPVSERGVGPKASKRVSFKVQEGEKTEENPQSASSLLPSASKYKTLSRLLTKLHEHDTASEDTSHAEAREDSPSDNSSLSSQSKGHPLSKSADPVADALPVQPCASWETVDSNAPPVRNAHSYASLSDFAAEASKEQLSQSVFEAQLYLAEQESIRRDQSKRSAGAKFLRKVKSVMNTEGLVKGSARVVKVAAVRLSAAKSSAKALGKVLLSWRMKRNKHQKA